MNCCEKCFKDIEIKAIIRTQNKKGKCDFCGSKNAYIVNILESTEIKENFERLLDVYSVEKSRPDSFPKEKMDLLKNILAYKWNYQWEDFVTEIKEKNRFHTDIINKDVLSKVLQSLFKVYKKGTIFYRARNCQNENGYTKDEMGAPPSQRASSGRANPEGISCLYLADSIDTTLYEIRAGIYDYVTVGKFVLKENIEVVNLADIDKISPFKDLDINLIAANISHLVKIGQNIAKPLRRFDSALDYLPTQYICDYIKSKGFAGIEYKSSMIGTGTNYAIFNEKLFKCTNTKVYEIQLLKYGYQPIFQ